MRVISLIFLLLFPVSAMSEIIYFGSTFKEVEVSSKDSTLILFPTPPISVSCQPALLQFEPLGSDGLSVRESQTFKAKELEEKNENGLSKRFLRLSPQAESGTSKCSFTLSSGSEVPLSLILKQDIAKPLIELKPIDSKFVNIGEEDRQLYILKAILDDKPIYLEETTSYLKCSSNVSPQCERSHHETTLGSYIIEYSGINSNVSAWKIRFILKKNSKFKELSDLKSSSGLLFYSLTKPQKSEFISGDTGWHYIVGQPSLTRNELIGMLP